MKKLYKEAQIKQKVKNLLKKYDVFYFMPSASVYGKSGIPDFICCLNGLFIAIEAKRESAGIKGLTVLQKAHQIDIQNSDGIFWIAYNEKSLEDIENKIKLIIDEDAI
jgi:hypothetical protein